MTAIYRSDGLFWACLTYQSQWAVCKKLQVILKNCADLQISQQKLCRTEIALCKVTIFWWDHITAVQMARFLRCAWWIDWLLVN